MLLTVSSVLAQESEDIRGPKPPIELPEAVPVTPWGMYALIAFIALVIIGGLLWWLLRKQVVTATPEEIARKELSRLRAKCDLMKADEFAEAAQQGKGQEGHGGRDVDDAHRPQRRAERQLVEAEAGADERRDDRGDSEDAKSAYRRFRVVRIARGNTGIRPTGSRTRQRGRGRAARARHDVSVACGAGSVGEQHQSDGVGDHGFEVVTQVARQPLLRQFGHRAGVHRRRDGRRDRLLARMRLGAFAEHHLAQQFLGDLAAGRQHRVGPRLGEQHPAAARIGVVM